MDIGTYADGRTITYEEATREFSIEGIRTTAELLVRYDNAGQVAWTSDSLRTWVHSFADSASMAAAAAPSQAPYQPQAAPAYGAAPASYGASPASYAAAPAAAAVPAYGADPTYGAAPAYAAVGVTNAAAAFSTVDAAYGALPTTPYLSANDSYVTPATTNVIGRRYAAFAIDWMVGFVGLIIAAIGVGVVVAVNGHGNPQAIDGIRGPMQLIFYVVFLGYFVMTEAVSGRTWGMGMMGLRVLTVEGGRISFPQALIRNLLLIVDTLFFTLPALITMRQSELHQRIGDLAAGTVVVRER